LVLRSPALPVMKPLRVTGLRIEDWKFFNTVSSGH
jgi:hypothetical protein